MGAGSQPVQMNVVLATIDNPRGEQISRLMCRVHRFASDRSAGDRTRCTVASAGAGMRAAAISQTQKLQRDI